MLTTLLASVAEMLALRDGGSRKVWVVNAAPWDSIRFRIPTPVEPSTEGLSRMKTGARNGRDQWTPVILGAFLIGGFLARFLWSGRGTLASHLFEITLAQTLFVYGCGAFLTAPPGSSANDALSFGIAALGLLLAGREECRANEILADMLALQEPSQRFAMWCLRMLPGILLIAFLAIWRGSLSIAIASGFLALATLFANLAVRPKPKGWELPEPEMREAAAALPIATLLLAGATFWFCSWTEPRAVVIESGKPRLVSWPSATTLVADNWTAPPAPVAPVAPKKLDIHWSKKKK